MTLRGRLFVGAGALVVATGLVLGLHDLTKIGLLLVLLTGLAVLLARRELDLDITRVVHPTRVTTDAHADVTVRVRNDGRLPTPLLRGEEGLAYALGDRPHLLVPRLDGGESRQLTYRVRSHVRGHHRIGPFTLRVDDPFGLATRGVTIPGEATLVVLPRVVPLSPVRGVAAGSGGETTTSPRIALHGEDDVAVREYRVGDDLRRIHWRSTARTGETMVRQDEQPTRRRALVLLDDRAAVHAGTRAHVDHVIGLGNHAHVQLGHDHRVARVRAGHRRLDRVDREIRHRGIDRSHRRRVRCGVHRRGQCERELHDTAVEVDEGVHRCVGVTRTWRYHHHDRTGFVDHLCFCFANKGSHGPRTEDEDDHRDGGRAVTENTFQLHCSALWSVFLSASPPGANSLFSRTSVVGISPFGRSVLLQMAVGECCAG